MATVTIVLLIVSLILLMMAAINWPTPSPIAFGWLGLFFYVLAQLLVGFK